EQGRAAEVRRRRGFASRAKRHGYFDCVDEPWRHQRPAMPQAERRRGTDLHGVLMSRIGKKPIAIPSGVKIEGQQQLLKVAGPKGQLSWSYPAGVKVAIDDKEKVVKVSRDGDSRQNRALHGTARALINNMVVGASQGYTRKLEIYGTGYSCKVAGSTF